LVFGKDPIWKAFFLQRWGRLPEELLKLVRSRESLWINTEAGGELTQTASLCLALKEELPEYNLLLSTHKYDAYQHALKISGVDYAFFSPWDIPLVVRKVLKAIKPKLLLSMEIVTAPVMLKEARSLGFTTLLCSGFMSKNLPKSTILKRPMALNFVHGLDFIAAKDEIDKQGFTQLGCPEKSIRVSGNLKYDLIQRNEIARIKEDWMLRFQLQGNNKVLIGASLHPGEDKFIVDAFRLLQEQSPAFKLIIVPRFSDFIPQVEEYLSTLKLSFIKRTEIDQKTVDSPDVIIIDTFGELPYIYAAASYVLLGSSIYPADPLGGHNIIEPMLHKIPVFHGPHMFKYQEVVDELKNTWPGLEVSTSRQLAENIIYLENDKALKKEITNNIDTIVQRHRGSTIKHVEFIKEILSEMKKKRIHNKKGLNS
jgi:3-deoxy-D-manno-octulosonic-acid transferase